MKTVDARGYSCPQPVLMTKAALKEGGDITVLVDNEAALNNIIRFAENNGFEAAHKKAEEDYEITIAPKVK